MANILVSIEKGIEIGAEDDLKAGWPEVKGFLKSLGVKM